MFTTGWVVIAAVTVLYVTSGMASTNADVRAFFVESHHDYADSILRLQNRANFISQITPADEIEAAAIADALTSLSYQTLALQKTDKCISQIEDAVQLQSSNQERFQARMDAIARNLYESRYKAEENSVLMEEEMMAIEDQLGDASDYIELVKSVLMASKSQSKVSKKPGKIYPDLSTGDEKKLLFETWRTMFVKVAWEFPENIEGYEICLDVVVYVERRLKDGSIPDYEYELIVDDKLNFRYANSSENIQQARWQ